MGVPISAGAKAVWGLRQKEGIAAELRAKEKEELASRDDVGGRHWWVGGKGEGRVRAGEEEKKEEEEGKGREKEKKEKQVKRERDKQ